MGSETGYEKLDAVVTAREAYDKIRLLMGPDAIREGIAEFWQRHAWAREMHWRFDEEANTPVVREFVVIDDQGRAIYDDDAWTLVGWMDKGVIEASEKAQEAEDPEYEKRRESVIEFGDLLSSLPGLLWEMFEEQERGYAVVLKRPGKEN